MASTKTFALPSNRSFGLLFLVVFAGLGFLGMRKGWPTGGIAMCFVASAVFGTLGIFNSVLLTPFNKAWLHLGLLMGKVVNPVVMGIIFFLIITPVAIIARLVGRDELKMKREAVNSYWIDRNPPGPESLSFKNQF